MAIIRQAEARDIPRLLALYDELSISHSEIEQAGEPSPEEYAATLERIQATPGYDLLVAEQAGEVVGLMSLVVLPNLAHHAHPWAIIEGLVVAATHRRRGIGRKLIEYAIARAREASCYKIELSSNRQRLEAHEFYRGIGFKDSALGFRMYF